MKNIKIKNRIAVVIYNLGGPNSRNDIEFFLFNLFNDKNIITIPNPFRYLLAKLISKLRKKEATLNYNKLGGKSPLLKNTIKQKQALEKILDKSTHKIFISMNFCNPLPYQTVKEVENFNPTKIVLVPLYPQFSTTTTASFLDKWNKAFSKSTLTCPQKIICCYYSQKEFIESSKKIFLNIYNKATKENGKPYVIFVAHGLPEKIIESGDPYQWQIENTVKLIVESANIKNLDYILAYQSRVGPVSWIKPYADEVIIKESKMNKNILIVPISFVSEHVETLVELDLEYKELAESNGAKSYYRAKTVSEDDFFIKGLKNLIINDKSSCETCPKKFNKCYKIKN
ncbi:ferrochelatase [Candidatus Aquarickettsia rohweri]|uniref:Ferrochelatase n=1 Tax=Candidatus Aquarickettsia rohweri TaxID=2602574 RepID=A0A429XV89_9RICK|nr:ferrochelatase [Candidatus Aquarickettsia rohweri]RST72185.1 ferrochelatase [Candidatus Aquarickettsia rohweri]